jgi:hypothetical protein
MSRPAHRPRGRGTRGVDAAPCGDPCWHPRTALRALCPAWPARRSASCARSWFLCPVEENTLCCRLTAPRPKVSPARTYARHPDPESDAARSRPRRRVLEAPRNSPAPLASAPRRVSLAHPFSSWLLARCCNDAPCSGDHIPAEISLRVCPGSLWSGPSPTGGARDRRPGTVLNATV